MVTERFLTHWGSNTELWGLGVHTSGFPLVISSCLGFYHFNESNDSATAAAWHFLADMDHSSSICSSWSNKVYFYQVCSELKTEYSGYPSAQPGWEWKRSVVIFSCCFQSFCCSFACFHLHSRPLQKGTHLFHKMSLAFRRLGTGKEGVDDGQVWGTSCMRLSLQGIDVLMEHEMQLQSCFGLKAATWRFRRKALLQVSLAKWITLL